MTPKSMYTPIYSLIRRVLDREIGEVAELREIVNSPINFGGNGPIFKISTDLAKLGLNSGVCLKVQQQLLCRVSAKSEN